MSRTIVSLVVMGLLVGCGVSKSQLDAKAVEAENYRRQYGDESERTKALEAKVAQLSAELEAAEANEARVSELRRKVEELSALNELEGEFAASILELGAGSAISSETPR